VLQDHEVHPVGDNQAVKVDVRVVAATNHDLEAEMEAGRFREDLYYRLNVIPIHLPPLRERLEDIPLLIEAFVRRHCDDRPRRFSRDAIRRLQSQPWRGNARELENAVERILALSDSDLLTAADLPLASAAQDDASAGESTQRALLHALAEAARNRLTLRQLEDLYIEQMLVVTGGKKGEAATRLGIDRKTLYRRDPTH
jgi:two-component system response regulator HydG